MEMGRIPVHMSQRSIIIVEDQAEVAEMLAEMVRVCGYNAVTCDISQTALGLIEEHDTAIVLLDIMMPDVSGIEILTTLRQDVTHTQIPVILISALSLPMDIHNGLAAGANAYLTKPVNFQELKRLIEQLANQ
jgi:DNA-binding response OmpR family regulator